MYLRKSVLSALVVTLLGIFLAASLPACSSQQPAGLVTVSGQALASGSPAADAAQPKNLILLIGDGMGESHIAATRYFYLGREGRLAMEKMPVFTQVHTFMNNGITTDSAAAGTAIATGVLTNRGVISQNPAGESVLDRSLLMLAKREGKSTGLITEVPITHATPAPFAAQVASRRDEAGIAVQYLDHRVDLLLGGGERFFVPAGSGVHCPEEARTTGEPPLGRADGRDLLAEFRAGGYQVVTNRAELMAAPLGAKAIGLFACRAMAYDLERPAHEPTSAEKLSQALEALNRNPKGFFVMAERGRIDWAAEANDALNTLGDTRAFDEMVRVALEFARRDGQTLVIAIADHEAGGLAMVFPDRFREPQYPPFGRDEIPNNRLTSKDGLELPINFATQPGHTAVPVGVRAFGPGATKLHEFNGSQHFVDLYALMRRVFIGD